MIYTKQNCVFISGDSGKRNIIEVKRTLSQQKIGHMNQAIAQTIVFSFLQGKEMSDLFLVPNVLISPKEFRVIMYDSKNDFLICSQPLCIFAQEERSLDKSSIIFLWMVLHYEIFSGTVNLKDSFDNNARTEISEALKAKFEEMAGTRFNIYRDNLKFCEQSIISPREEYFPNKKSLVNGTDVFFISVNRCPILQNMHVR